MTVSVLLMICRAASLHWEHFLSKVHHISTYTPLVSLHFLPLFHIWISTQKKCFDGQISFSLGSHLRWCWLLKFSVLFPCAIVGTSHSRSFYSFILPLRFPSWVNQVIYSSIYFDKIKFYLHTTFKTKLLWCKIGSYNTQ